MAKETVQAVRQAELNAAQAEKEATLKRDEIILKAHEEAKTIIVTMTKDAAKNGEESLSLVQSQGEELLKAAELKAEKEILLLKEMVKSKEQTAINLILSEVV
ncbi:MAG: hypothetical protein K0R92_172 [Lachnospiraceae bacterium]|jgi:vacuolar-type H+-ATPase subunit H|nr:hypothetical protein [Anaerocolumna sp.]MDF2608698.1 hypothetical protein [Lachnospiraceae bacterium]